MRHTHTHTHTCTCIYTRSGTGARPGRTGLDGCTWICNRERGVAGETGLNFNGRRLNGDGPTTGMTTHWWRPGPRAYCTQPTNQPRYLVHVHGQTRTNTDKHSQLARCIRFDNIRGPSKPPSTGSYHPQDRASPGRWLVGAVQFSSVGTNFASGDLTQRPMPDHKGQGPAFTVWGDCVPVLCVATHYPRRDTTPQ